MKIENRMTHRRFMTTLMLLLIPLMPQAIVWANPYLESPTPDFRYDDSRDAPWIEEETKIPALPGMDDLQHLTIEGLPRGLRLFLDTARVTVDPKDEVIRLWLYVRSDQGVDNGTYEGFRCATGEYKVYGYATPDRKPPVTRAKNSVWRVTRENPSNRYRRALMRGYLCGLRGARPPAEIQQAVRVGKPKDTLLLR